MTLTGLGLAKAFHLGALVLLLWSSLRKNLFLTPISVTGANAQRTTNFDKLSAAAAGVMLLTGLAMLLWLGKPTAYYTANPSFWLKMVIFVVASGLIVWTKVFIRRAKSQVVSTVPGAVRWVMRFDFAGILLMGVLGFAVAYGY